MSNECPPDATAKMAHDDALQPQGHRRIEQIDQPARPLGEKRAALRARKSAVKPGVNAPPAWVRPGERVLTSIDASTTYAIRRTSKGVVIERTQQRPVGARLVQTMMFDDEGRFDRWCALEPLRFDEPVLHDLLRREGHDAFGGKW